jgi:hypothetical protein
MYFPKARGHAQLRSGATLLVCFQLRSTTIDMVRWIGSLVGNMTTQTIDHLQELAEMLALGLTRLLARKSSNFFQHSGESSLHFSPDQSGGRPIPENGEPL